MILVIFRHAERGEDGLSHRGRQQAQKLADLPSALGRPNRLLCSPQKRSQETFRPLSEKLSLPVNVISALDERQQQETSKQFTERVHRFLDQIPTEVGTVFICTHLDWIEEALLYLDCDQDLLSPKYQSWSPGQHLKLRWDEGIWILEGSGRIE